MKPIKLSHGKGNGVDAACLMTATSMLIGKPEELDKTSCVCPVIGSFIRTTNDAMPEDILQEQYGDLPWVIHGSRTDDLEVIQKRAFHFADVACRQLLPIALGSDGLIIEAEKARGLPEIVDAKTARSAIRYAARYAAKSAEYADYATMSAAMSAEYADYATMSAAKYAAMSAGYAARYATDGLEVWKICRQAIIDACNIGVRNPADTVMTREELSLALNKT
jgi:hypothetical protein